MKGVARRDRQRGKGMYRYVDNGRRFLPGKIPTAPIKFFDPPDTITRFTSVPAEMQAADVPEAAHEPS